MRWSSGFWMWTVAITMSGSVATWSESAHAFRPFDGTDASVADVGEFELELEPLGLLRQGSERTVIAPQMVLNLGVADGWEAVLQGQGETPLAPASANATLAENGAFLKGVIRDGVLQGKSGPSIATEFGVLLPGVNDEAGLGASWAGVISYRLGPATVHFNAEVALTRQRHGEIFLSTIVEGPYEWVVRPVAEIAYDRETSVQETSSVLVGAIWQFRDDLAFDFAVRQGRRNNQSLTEVRAGVTYSFRLWRPRRD
jgi:hypothetical protein